MMWDDEKLIKTLIRNGVVVMPTDTLYGIVGRAQDKNVVEKIYKIRKRNSRKPCIILIGEINELKKFGIILSEKEWKEIKKYDKPVSFVVNCVNRKFTYLHRGTKTLAFRVPVSKELRGLLLKVGPLIAPSANPENLPSSKTISEAKEYFGDLVDLYVNGGKLDGKPSKVIKLHKDGSVSILRE